MMKKFVNTQAAINRKRKNVAEKKKNKRVPKNLRGYQWLFNK
jgi:hypothetical protein